MAFKATGIGDLTPDQLRALAGEYRAAAISSAYPATAASLLRLAERYDELAAERGRQSETSPKSSVSTSCASMPHYCSDPRSANGGTRETSGKRQRA